MKKNFFEILLKKYQNISFINSVFDYKTDDAYIELKSRRNTKDKYPTTMVGYNKIKQADKYLLDGYRIFFYFHFTDGYYYFEYTGQKLEKKIAGRCDRGKNEYKDYCFIPVNQLKEIEY